MALSNAEKQRRFRERRDARIRELERQVLRSVRGGAQDPSKSLSAAGKDLLRATAGERFATVLADPPWQFRNRTGKVAPEHRRLHRYPTMTLDEIKDLPVAEILKPTAHLYLWTPNALLAEGLAVMAALGVHLQGEHRLAQDP
jgi:hypothetical protein